MLNLFSVQNFQAALVVVPGALLLWKIVYNLYFHPLAKFPGPLLGRITPLHDVALFLKGPQKGVSDVELLKKYGPVVRVRPNTLIFQDAKLIPLVYHRKADKGSYYHFMGSELGVFTVIKHTDHAMMRKMIAAPFGGAAVKNMRPIVEGLVDEWIEAIDQEIVRPGKVVDFGPWGEYLTYDVITRLCFGEPYGFIQSRTDKGGLIEGLHKSLLLLGVLSRLPLLGAIVKTFALSPKASDKSGLGVVMEQRDRLVEARINERKNGATEKRYDVLEHLLDAEPRLSLADIKNTLLTFMTAGSDTSASFFRCFLICMHTHQEIYKELVDELLLAKKENSLMNSNYKEMEGKDNLGQQGSGMSLLDACIRETLRYYPVAPQPFTRLVSPGGLFLHGGDSKKQVFIPEGVEMHAAMIATNRDPSVYGEDADVWDPYRWINSSREKVADMDRYLITFGWGSRVCLGKPIAELEIELGLKKFLTTFEPEFVYPERPAEKVTEHGVILHDGFWMRIKRRESLEN